MVQRPGAPSCAWNEAVSIVGRVSAIHCAPLHQDRQQISPPGEVGPGNYSLTAILLVIAEAFVFLVIVAVTVTVVF
jgi:hypothetical protein